MVLSGEALYHQEPLPVSEALELRDNDLSNFLGKSVTNAVSNINNDISNSINTAFKYTQETFDKFLIDLDGTSNKETWCKCYSCF